MRESAKKKIEQENRVLLAAGFQPEDEGKNVLWRKNGMWFGRTAALQPAMRLTVVAQVIRTVSAPGPAIRNG